MTQTTLGIQDTGRRKTASDTDNIRPTQTRDEDKRPQ